MTAKPIVAATDGSQHSLRAVEWAATEAVLRGAPLRIVSAATLLPRMAATQDDSDVGTVHDVLLRNRDQGLATAAARAAAVAPDLLIDTDTLAGAPAQAVADSGSGALMLVLGSRGAGAFTALILGSVSRYVASHAACPVVVIRDVAPTPHHLVAVGLADLDDCADALTFAFEEAALRKASLTAVHAWDAPQAAVMVRAEDEARRQLAGLLDSWQARYPNVQVTQEVANGHPARALVGLSDRADLVVIGRHAAHTGSPGPGAVRHALLNHAHGPVATVPSA